MFGTTVDFVGDNRVAFDKGGNKYRLVAHVACRYKRILITFVGTHGEYDRIDAVSCDEDECASYQDRG